MPITELPYAADAEMSLNYDELEVCRRLLSTAFVTYLSQVLRLQYQKELAQNHVTTQTKFNYSWGLVKSPMRDHQVEGVRLLQGVYIPSLLRTIESYRMSTIEIYRAEPARRRECLYYLALGHYKMGNFEEARKFNGVSNLLFEDILSAYSDPQALLIEKEPTNLQAQSLGQLIDRGVARGQFPFFFSLNAPYTRI